MKIFTLILFSFAASLFAQVENSRGEMPYKFAPEFYIDIASYKSDTPGNSRIDVFLKVPYSNLQFIKIKDGYRASYRVTFSIFSEDKEKLIAEKEWKEKALVKDFGLTKSSKNANISYKKIETSPGRYFMRCAIEDLDSKKTAEFEQNISIRKFNENFDLSDIVFIERKIKTKKKERLIPNISNIITSQDSSIDFFYYIYSLSARKVLIKYKVVNSSDDSAVTASESKELKSGVNHISDSVRNLKLGLGDYKLIINIYDENGNNLSSASKKFQSVIYGFPPSVKDLDKSVDEMMYIASQEDIDYIQEAENYNDKLKRFIEFWKRRDPSPGAEGNEILWEYYRRVEYANAHFNSYYEGWRTDMGMIYITLGPPDQVDRHPFDDNMKPYQVWSYYDINRQFVFIDHTGFGDYRLYQPVYGDWYRYRQ